MKNISLRNYKIADRSLNIHIERGNAAFEDNPNEAERILGELRTKIIQFRPKKGEVVILFDINGNRAGQATVV